MFRSAHDLLDDKVHEKRDNVQIEGVFGLVSVCWKPGLVPTRGQGAVVAATGPAVDLQLTDLEGFLPAFSGSSFEADSMTPPLGRKIIMSSSSQVSLANSVKRLLLHDPAPFWPGRRLPDLATHRQFQGPLPCTASASASAEHHSNNEEGLHDQKHHYGGNHDAFLPIPSPQGRISHASTGITGGRA